MSRWWILLFVKLLIQIAFSEDLNSINSKFDSENIPGNIRKNVDSLNLTHYTATNSCDNISLHFSNQSKTTHDELTNLEINEKVNTSKKRKSTSIKESDVLEKLCRRFKTFPQLFDPARSSKVSQKCKKHVKEYFRALHRWDLWALKMFDSSGRVTSGLLNGNVNQFGDYEQCLQTESADATIKGQYCLAYIQPSIPGDSLLLKQLYNLVQSHNAFSSHIDDPGHRIPRFSLTNWALCVPASCSPSDIEHSLGEYMANLTNDLEISVMVRVYPQMCQVKNNMPADFNTELTILFFAIIFLMCCISTTYEMRTAEVKQSDVLVVFSLRKNVRWLFNTEDDPHEIKTVHGIRFINAVMLIFSHKSMAVFFNPYINRTQLSETLGKPWTVIGRAASLYTDPFLLFSGMLTTYSVIGRLQTGRSARLTNEYIGRLLRILPNLIALILFCTYILPNLGSGPQWNLVVRHHSDLCRKYWWRNLLFIHNYYGFNNMCLTHTHHLGIDMQLFALTPLAALLLWKTPRNTIIVLSALIVISSAARFYTTVANDLSNYVYFGATISRMFKTADYMYISPPHRSSVYMLGIILGYCLRKYKNMKLTPIQLYLGWLLCIACLIVTLIVPSAMSNMDYVYNSFDAAFYAALAPLGWCAIFSWIIVTAHLGYENVLSKILSWRGFQVTTKLSYAIYLTQFPVFFYNVGRKRNADFYSFLGIMLDINEFLCILAASVILTFMFDAPFQHIKRILFMNAKLQKSSNQDKKNKIC